MLTLILALQLAAAPARAPVAPKAADAVVHVASPQTALPELRAFLTQAGAYAPILKPGDLGRTLGAMLGADLLDPASLTEAGLDASAPMTLGFLAEGTVVCGTQLKGGKAVTRARASMAGAGQPAKQAYKGVTLEGAAAGAQWRGGFAARANALCVASGGSDALVALKAAVDALVGAGFASTLAFKAAPQATAPVLVYFQGRGAGGVVELRSKERTLELLARVQGPAWLDKPGDADALAAFAPDAPLSARAQVSSKALGDPRGPASMLLGGLLGAACKGCDATLVRTLLESLRPQLTGAAGFVATGIDPSAAGQPLAQYFLVPHAYLLTVKDAAAAQKAVEAGLEKLRAKGATVTPVEMPEGAQWAVGLGSRDLRVGLSRGALFLANDRAALDLALAGLAAPGRAQSAASFRLDGPKATSAVRRVSVLDVPKSQELAALFAFGVEAGALLKAAGTITGVVEPEAAGWKLSTALTLPPPPPGPGAVP